MRALATLGLLLLLSVAWAAARPSNPFSPVSKLRPGMTADEVQRLLGPPQRTARQILYRRYLEMWTYEGSSPVYVEFNAPHGEEMRIVTVHPASVPQ